MSNGRRSRRRITGRRPPAGDEAARFVINGLQAWNRIRAEQQVAEARRIIEAIKAEVASIP